MNAFVYARGAGTLSKPANAFQGPAVVTLVQVDVLESFQLRADQVTHPLVQRAGPRLAEVFDLLDRQQPVAQFLHTIQLGFKIDRAVLGRGRRDVVRWPGTTSPRLPPIRSES